ncbi:MAG: zinc-ribbon domain-containing protein [Bacilli bacterium]
MLDGTRDETVKTVKSCVDTIKTDNTSSSGIVCPSCGTKNEPGAKFCDHCGASLTKTCSSCGEVNYIDSSYCRKCGKPL